MDGKKRQTDSLFHNSEKKVKTSDENLENDISIFESTLDLNDVNSIFENTETSNQNVEFDAFASYLCTFKNDKVKEGRVTEISQNINISENIETQLDKIVNTVKEKTEVFPLLHSFEERIKTKKESHNTLIDQEINERTAIFEAEPITAQFRQDVDNLFDELEQTIFTMGLDTKNKTIPDDILDVIFDEDYKNQTTKEEVEKKVEQTALQLNESVLNNYNKGFCDIIKKALLNNNVKSIMVKKEIDNLQNNSTQRYCCLGPFYGLPFKVKELIIQYKGIKELYGESLKISDCFLFIVLV